MFGCKDNVIKMTGLPLEECAELPLITVAFFISFKRENLIKSMFKNKYLHEMLPRTVIFSGCYNTLFFALNSFFMCWNVIHTSSRCAGFLRGRMNAWDMVVNCRQA